MGLGRRTKDALAIFSRSGNSEPFVVADLSPGDAENARPVYRISPIERGGHREVSQKSRIAVTGSA
jgi:hypothetical protein